MKMFLWIISSTVSLSLAQISITATAEIPIPSTIQWHTAIFSPSGKELYLTTVDYNGIWQYSLESRLLKEITRERHSGFDFSLSDDGTKIAYRTTVTEGDHKTRVQIAVVQSLKDSEQKVLHRGNSIQTPKFIDNEALIPDNIGETYRSITNATSATTILGVEDGSIALLDHSVKKSIDPLNSGRYIWPVLSPDKSQLAAVEMDRGAFIAAVDGSNVIRLGKCDAPQWTRDGRWIIGMHDSDDGHRITGSEIIAISADGTTRLVLTETPERHEMFPSVSPAENSIVVTTADGKVLMLSYKEGK